MRIENHACNLDVVSIYTGKDKLKLIKQKATDIQLHDVKTIYKVLSKNDKNWTKETIFGPGYFNNKTNFLLGNENSIVILDKDLNILQSPDNNIDNIIDKDDLFILYPIPCFNLKQNDSIIYKDLNTKEELEIMLDSNLGYTLGKFLAENSHKEVIHPNQNFLKLIIDTKNGLSINKNFLINSNPEFLISILKGYYYNNKSSDCNFIINKDVNLYIFTNILNYLGASYSIRKKDNGLKLIFQLPHIFKDIIDNRFIKKEYYSTYFNKIELNNTGIALDASHDILETTNCKNILIPVNSLLFEEVTQDESYFDLTMYDLTAENLHATNYALPFTPFLKNSDGDILTIAGLFLQEANDDMKTFSPESKDFYKSLNDGTITNWIADDAILGLYASTK